MIGREKAHVAVASIDGGEINVLDQVVEVEEGVGRAARRVLWVGGRFKKSKYLPNEQILAFVEETAIKN